MKRSFFNLETIAMVVVLFTTSIFYVSAQSVRRERVVPTNLTVTTEYQDETQIYNIIHLKVDPIPGATEYRWFVNREGPNSKFSPMNPTKANNHMMLNISGNVTYYFRVSAVVNGEETEQSTPVSIVTPRVRLMPVREIKVNARNTNSVNLNITHGSIEQTHYRVYVANQGSDNFRFVEEKAGTSFVVGSLKLRNRYTYRVVAVDKSGIKLNSVPHHHTQLFGF